MNRKLLTSLRNYFVGQPIEKAWLFGSYARGEQREDSDVDILVKLDQNAKISLLGFIHIKNELEDLLGRSVDLVEDGQLLPFAAKTAEQDKILVYERKS